jgi:hypothetical protein
MDFPDGFTGFRRWEELPHPAIDLSVFKSVCYAAARALGGTVVSFEFAKVTPNFHGALIEWGYEPKRVSVLCNRAHYLVAFCEPKPPHSCGNEYMDEPELAAAFAQVSDWRVITKTELETVVDDEMIRSMSEPDRQTVERARRKGWFGPCETVGDLIFHYFD